MKLTFLNLHTNAKELVDYLLSVSNETVIYTAHTEWTLGGYSSCDDLSEDDKNNIVNHLKTNNVHLKIITGHEQGETINDSTTFLFNAATVYNWHLGFVSHLTVPYGNMRPTVASDIKQLFVSLIRLPHPHRCLTIDTLAKYNLLEKGIYSYLLPFVQGVEQKTNYEFKYWENPRRITLPSEPNHEHVGDLTVLPVEYWNGLIDIVVESSPDIKFYTEKTLKAIAACKPFLIIGAKGINKHLERYGFRLYTELFDYEFDQCDNIEDRIELAIQQIKKLENENYSELYSKVKVKAEDNLRAIYNWSINNKNGAVDIPDEFLEKLNMEWLANATRNYYKNKGYTEILNV